MENIKISKGKLNELHEMQELIEINQQQFLRQIVKQDLCVYQELEVIHNNLYFDLKVIIVQLVILYILYLAKLEHIIRKEDLF